MSGPCRQSADLRRPTPAPHPAPARPPDQSSPGAPAHAPTGPADLCAPAAPPTTDSRHEQPIAPNRLVEQTLAQALGRLILIRQCSCFEEKQEGRAKDSPPRHEGATAILNCRWCGPRRAVRFARLAAQSEHGRGAPFLHKTLTLLPKKPSSSRCASIAVALRGAFLNFLEERELPSVVAVRTKNLQRKCAESKAWNDIDEHRHAGQFTVQLFGWTEARRLVVVRERMRESKPRWAAICRMCRATPFGSG